MEFEAFNYLIYLISFENLFSMLLGVSVGLVIGAIVSIRQQFHRRGFISAPDIAMKFSLPAFLTFLILAGL